MLFLGILCVFFRDDCLVFDTFFFYYLCLKLKLRVERLANFGNSGSSRRAKVKVFTRLLYSAYCCCIEFFLLLYPLIAMVAGYER